MELVSDAAGVVVNIVVIVAVAVNFVPAWVVPAADSISWFSAPLSLNNYSLSAARSLQKRSHYYHV